MLKVNQLTGFGVGGSESGFRFLRFFMPDVNSYPYITELYWIAGGIDYPTVAMTSDTAPAPLVASAIGLYSGSAYGAFDKVTGSLMTRFGLTANSSLTIDLGAGNTIIPTGIGLVLSGTISSFKCYGSNTGTFTGEEKLLYTGPSATSGTRVNFTF